MIRIAPTRPHFHQIWSHLTSTCFRRSEKEVPVKGFSFDGKVIAATGAYFQAKYTVFYKKSTDCLEENPGKIVSLWKAATLMNKVFSYFCFCTWHWHALSHRLWYIKIYYYVLADQCFKKFYSLFQLRWPGSGRLPTFAINCSNEQCLRNSYSENLSRNFFSLIWGGWTGDVGDAVLPG